VSASRLPLDGLRILAFSQLGAGPFGLQILSDLGAEVVKVEQPATRGDEGRHVPPFTAPDDSLYYQAFNRGTRSVALDVAHPEGRALLHRLVPRFDAVFNNLRGDLTQKLGLDYAALGPLHPRVVCCSLSGFGRTGPRVAEPAYDFLLQAYGGFMSVTGEPDAPPTRAGISVVDFGGGILGALALMIGVHRAQAHGIGGDVDASLFDTALSMLNYMGLWSLSRGWEPARHPDGSHQSLVPVQTFRTADGWIVVMVMKDKFWGRLCERIGRPDLAADARFAASAGRLAHRSEVVREVGAALARRTTAEWLERLRGHVPVAPVYDVAEALADEHTLAREMVVDVEHPVFGPLREIGCPIKVDDLRPRYAPGAALGADTAAVLAEVGVGGEELARLRALGVVGVPVAASSPAGDVPRGR
jgi:crotonobetainyl-CoA:carnitine CoA-transferase CaiB-like acyl-CoA transferase